MAVRPAPASDLARLVRDLSLDDVLRRESAIARLAIIGAPAIDPAAALARRAAAPPIARVAALQTLAAIRTAKVIEVARDLIGDADDAVAAEALGCLRDWLDAAEPASTAAFDVLAAVVVDRAAPAERRRQAFASLGALPAKVLKPLREALARDVALPILNRATSQARPEMPSLEDLLARGFDGDCGDVETVVKTLGLETRLATIKRAVDAVREREKRSVDAAEQDRWRHVRGVLHHTLAERRSRIALYDLRETLDRTDGPLPVGFLAAASAVGDATCLEPIAHAWMRARKSDRWWREHLADAFRVIVRRDAITRRHETLRRILHRWPDTGVLVAAARKS